MINKIKLLATCEICKLYSKSPILLPCSSNHVCKDHLNLNNGNEYQPNEIKCPRAGCDKQHVIPDEGFLANPVLKTIIEQSEYLNEDEKKISLIFESSLKNLENLNADLKKKEPELNQHVRESLAKIKEQIKVDVKIAKYRLDKEASQLFDHIIQFESDCFKSVEKISRIEKIQSGVEEINHKWDSRKREINFFSDDHKDDRMELKLCIDTKIKEIGSKLNEFEKEKLSVERLIYKPNRIDELFGKLELEPKKWKLITSVDKDLKVWDMSKAACIKDLIGHQTRIISLTQSQSGLLISGSSDGAIKFWDMNQDYSCTYTITESHAVSSLAMSETNDLISGFSDGTIKVWDSTAWKFNKALNKHTEAVVVLFPMPNNELISCSSTIYIWNMITSMCLHSFINDSTVFCIAITKQKLLISGSEDGMIKVWSVMDSKKIRDLTGKGACILSLEMSKHDELFCSGDADGIIRVWNLSNWNCLKVLEKQDNTIAMLRIVDNRQLISCSGDCTVLVWNLNNYECVSTLKRNEAAIQCATLIADQ